MDLPSEWLCSIRLFVLYARSLASMLTGLLIDGQTSLVFLLVRSRYCIGRLAFDNDYQRFVEFFVSGFNFNFILYYFILYFPSFCLLLSGSFFVGTSWTAA